MLLVTFLSFSALKKKHKRKKSSTQKKSISTEHTASSFTKKAMLVDEKVGVTHKNGAMLPKKRGELIAYTHKNMNTTIQVRCYDTIMTLTAPL